MEDIFNPYRQWLGWEQSRGPDYYELLAIDRAQTDPARIALAAEQAMRKVRSFRPGPHAQVWSRLLDEIRAARDCLSNPGLKADYDAALARTDRFRSAAGDLGTPLVAVAVPPLSESAGPAPIYDSQHNMVSVPAAPQRASGTSNEYECTPLPGAIDELLPPGAEEVSPVETDDAPQATTPDGGTLAVARAPTAGRYAAAKARQARRGLALAVIGSAAVIGVAVGIYVWRSSRQSLRSEETTTAELAPAAAPSKESAQSEAPRAKPNTAALTSLEQETGPADSSGGEPSAPEPAASSAAREGIDPAATSIAPQPGLSPPEQRAKLQALVAALQTAKEALAEQDFVLADEQLKRAASLAQSPKHRAAVARLAEIAGYVKHFRDAVAATVQSMQAAETFKLPSGNDVAFVEGFPDKVTLRVRGLNSTYAFRDLPPALALAIADRRLPPRNPASAIVKGAYLAVQKQDDSRVREKAKSFWEQAEVGGVKTAHLLPFLTDDYAEFLKDLPE